MKSRRQGKSQAMAIIIAHQIRQGKTVYNLSIDPDKCGEIVEVIDPVTGDRVTKVKELKNEQR